MAEAQLENAGTVLLEGGKSFFWMGEGTLKIPFSMHKRHREKMCERLRAVEMDAGTVVFVTGGAEVPVYETDTSWIFRQESNFQWLFGVKEPDCYGVVDVATARSTLFIPRLAPQYAAWMGPIKQPEWFQRAYEVDEVYYVDQIAEVLREKAQAKKLLVLRGVNRDSGLSPPPPTFKGIDQFTLSDDDLLWNTMTELRVVKDKDELAILQYTNDVSELAHIEVMRAVAKAPSGPCRNAREYISEATFRYYSMLRGCHRCGYTCIAPSGPRNAVLHYGHSAEPNSVEVRREEMKLHDMGAEYHCYTADVTVSFPASGTFTEPQRTVYEAVWAAVLAVERAARPGVTYRNMHRLAERTLLERMTAAGLFQGSVEAMVEAHLMSNFMPHGLGHCLGLDVHDVGGYAPGENRKDDPTIEQNLRCGRMLMEGMVVTVEPGFYFIAYLIKDALSDPAKAGFINTARLDELRGVGGVRIEDNVVITASGCRVLSGNPREVADVERVMREGPESWISTRTYREYTTEEAVNGKATNGVKRKRSAEEDLGEKESA